MYRITRDRLYVVSVKYRLSLPDDGSYVITKHVGVIFNVCLLDSYTIQFLTSTTVITECISWLMKVTDNPALYWEVPRFRLSSRGRYFSLAYFPAKHGNIGLIYHALYMFFPFQLLKNRTKYLSRKFKHDDTSWKGLHILKINNL